MEADWTVVCCIYHKPRAVGESSDESSSDSSSDSDSDDDGSARPAGGNKPKQHKHHHHNPHDGHGPDCAGSGTGHVKDESRKARMPTSMFRRREGVPRTWRRMHDSA